MQLVSLFAVFTDCLQAPQVQFLDKVICPWLNDRFHGLDSAEN